MIRLSLSDKANKYIQEHNMSKAEFGRKIGVTSYEIYYGFKHDFPSFTSSYYAVKIFFDKLEKEENKEKYGLYVSDYAIEYLNRFIEAINKYINNKNKTLHLTYEDVNFYYIDGSEKGSHYDIFAYLEKHGVKILKIDNYYKGGWDSNMHCNLYFDLSNLSTQISMINM